MPKKELAAQAGQRQPRGQGCPLQGAHWSGQELTLQLSALAKDGEGMGALCWPLLI